MKIFSALAILAILYSCSSAEPAPDTPPLPLPDENNAAAPSPSAASESSPLLDLSDSPASVADSASSTDSLLATPVEGEAAATTDKPVDSLLSSDQSGNLPKPTALAEPAPLATQEEHNTLPAANSGASGENSDPYADFARYQREEKLRAEKSEHFKDRALFPHEDGQYQFGLDYTRSAFPGYNFSSSVTSSDIQGGTLSFTYFPIRSLSYGGLGIGVEGGMYWPRLQVTTEVNTTAVVKKHLIDTAGLKLIYEFDYYLGQLFVPFAFYSYQKVSIRSFNIDEVGLKYAGFNSDMSAYGAGLHWNLNRLEPTTASTALAATGIRKTYLTYTLFVPSSNFLGKDASHYLGLRFEY